MDEETGIIPVGCAAVSRVINSAITDEAIYERNKRKFTNESDWKLLIFRSMVMVAFKNLLA
jgi:hypothetical protein